MLTPSELAAMREVQLLTLIDTATIYRRTYSSDGAGGQAETVSTSTAACRVAPSNNMPDQQAFGGVTNEAQLWRITFAYNTDVQKNDRIGVGTRTFEVVGVLAPESRETARIVIAVER